MELIPKEDIDLSINHKLINGVRRDIVSLLYYGIWIYIEERSKFGNMYAIICDYWRNK